MLLHLLLISLDFNPRSLTGATIGHINNKMPTNLFQSTLPHGSDQQLLPDHKDTHQFQSTLPHGSDRISCANVNLTARFQSTLPHGSDVTADYTSAKQSNISIRRIFFKFPGIA